MKEYFEENKSQVIGIIAFIVIAILISVFASFKGKINNKNAEIKRLNEKIISIENESKKNINEKYIIQIQDKRLNSQSNKKSFFIESIFSLISLIFSYIALKSSSSVANMNLHNNKNNIKSKAYTTYYSLYNNINILVDMYIYYIIENNSDKLNEAYDLNLNEDWINDLVQLRDFIDYEFLDLSMDLFNDIKLLNRYKQSNDIESFKKKLNYIINNIIRKEFIIYLDIIDITKKYYLLKPQFLLIMITLNEIMIKYNYRIQSIDVLQNKSINLNSTNIDIKCSRSNLIITNEHIIVKNNDMILFELQYDNNSELIYGVLYKKFVQKSNSKRDDIIFNGPFYKFSENNYPIFNGFNTINFKKYEYFTNSNMFQDYFSYVGKMEKGLYHGYGTLFKNDKIYKQGYFNKGRIIEGSLIKKNYKFDGTFNLEKPQDGKLQFNKHYTNPIYTLSDFDGKIKDGLPIKGSGRTVKNFELGKNADMNSMNFLEDIESKYNPELKIKLEEKESYMNELHYLNSPEANLDYDELQEYYKKSDLVFQKMQNDNHYKSLIETANIILTSQEVDITNGEFLIKSDESTLNYHGIN